MAKVSLWVWSALLLAGAAGGLAVSAQAPAPAARPESTGDAAVAALVTEVRALRTDLAAMAIASVRSQLLVARVQLQEQRLVHLDRQRGEISAKLRDVEAGRAMFAGQMKPLTDPASTLTPDQRRDAEVQLGVFKAQLDAMQATENALRSEENALLNSIATEQARWTDFNSRLDQVEQSLPKR